ncbi:MAG: response regulator, partial [Treponema sp.]|nr:response regulator [Treponema sp.]
EYADAHGFVPEIVTFNGVDDCEKALESGSIDAMLMNDIHKSNFYKIADCRSRNMHIAVAKDKSQIATEIDRAITSINRDMPDFLSDMKSRYYKTENYREFKPTESEREYIKNAAPIRVACTVTWYPISYFKDGKYCGPLAEVYEALSRVTGLKFNYVPYKSYTSALAGIIYGESPVLCEAPLDFAYATEYKMNLTSGLTDISILQVQDKKRQPRNPPVVAELGSAYISKIGRKLYGKDAMYKMYSSASDCMKAVLSGDADYTLLNSYQAAVYQANVKYINMQYTVIPEYQYTICAGVSSRADERLLSIMSKGIQALGENYITSIFRKELSLEQEADLFSFFYRNPSLLILFITLIMFIILGVPAAIIYIMLMRRKNTALVRANNERIDFVSKMSHDLRTPLNGILGMVYLSKKEDNPENTSNYLKKIELSGNYLLSILNDILDINKMGSKKISLSPAPYSFEEFADELHVLFDPLCQKKDISFSTEFPKLEKKIFTDKMRFMQLFSNLVSNSIKYTANGGKIKVYCKNYSYADDAFVSDIVVEDTGIGMSKAFQQHMFEPFAQERNTAASMGTGLGLAIVKQIVTLMGGFIRVESEQNKGTSFFITLVLPLVEGETAPVSEGAKLVDKTSILEGLHILVCEDDSINAEITAELIRRGGMTADIAKNGQEGLDLFDKSPENYYAAILMDIRMPIMDGWEATSKIRALNRSDAATVPIIALSADAFVQERMTTSETGLTGNLPKPINPQKLYDSLADYMEKRASR